MSEWTQIGSDINGEYADDYSGYSVSLSSDGSVVAIGAIGNGDYSGHVRVYYKTNPPTDANPWKKIVMFVLLVFSLQNRTN